MKILKLIEMTHHTISFERNDLMKSALAVLITLIATTFCQAQTFESLYAEGDGPSPGGGDYTMQVTAEFKNDDYDNDPAGTMDYFECEVDWAIAVGGAAGPDLRNCVLEIQARKYVIEWTNTVPPFPFLTPVVISRASVNTYPTLEGIESLRVEFDDRDGVHINCLLRINDEGKEYPEEEDEGETFFD